MKRFIIISILILICGLILAPLAHAVIGDFIKAQFNTVIASGIFAIIATIFGKKYLKFKKPVMEILDVYFKIKDVKALNSPGGKRITKAEQEEVIKEIVEAVESLVAVVPASWIAKIRRS